MGSHGRAGLDHPEEGNNCQRLKKGRFTLASICLPTIWRLLSNIGIGIVNGILSETVYPNFVTSFCNNAIITFLPFVDQIGLDVHVHVSVHIHAPV